VLAPYGVINRRPLFKRFSLRFVAGPLLRDAAAVHFTSTEERDQAQRLGIQLRSAVIPLGVVNGESQTPLPVPMQAARDPLRVLFMSRLDPKKNLESLLAAAALLRDAGCTAKYVIAGKGEPSYVESLKARAAGLSLDNAIEWLGHVTGDAKSEALRTADLFVLPSHSENFGIAAAEALAAGVPCVLGRGVAISHAVVDAGAGEAVEPEPEALAASIRRFLESADLRTRAAAAATRLARSEYSTQAMADRLVALYGGVRKPVAPRRTT
jgi:glycosyltransferase involved in cell wall biosynthesis